MKLIRETKCSLNGNKLTHNCSKISLFPLILMNSMKKNLQKSALNFIVCNVMVTSSSAICSKFTVTVALYITIYAVHLVMRMI